MSVKPDDNVACPLCDYPSASVRETDHGERCHVVCPRCGKFGGTYTGIQEATRVGIKHLISAWLRDRHEHALDSPEVTQDWVRAIANALPQYGVLDKQLLLLRHLARQSECPGASVHFYYGRDASMVWAKTGEEAKYLLNSLLESQLLVPSLYDRAPLESVDYGLAITITALGWRYLDEHRSGQQTGHQGFIAMAFKDEMNGARDAIFQALHRAGYRPYRTDAAPHIERIDSKIIAEIRNSRFLIADAAHQRQGVYFEAGFAMALGLPVFWSVRDDDEDNLHFDIRQFNHIAWKDEAHLEDQLYDFVVAILGRGPLPAN